jgi:hypothetical protein
MTLQHQRPLLRGVICAVCALWAVAAMAQPDLILSTDETFSLVGIAPGQQEASTVEFGTGTWDHPQWLLDAALPLHVSIDAIDDQHEQAIFFSVDCDVSLGGTLYADEDIIQWNGTGFSMGWDGSANGVPLGGDLNALFVTSLSPLSFVCSFDSDVVVPTIFAIDALVSDEDVVGFIPGGFALIVFDGSAEGLPTGADCDAVSFPTSQDILLSFDEALVINTVLYDDADVILWNTSTGFDATPWFEASAFGIPPEVNLVAVDDSAGTPTTVGEELWSIYR